MKLRLFIGSINRATPYFAHCHGEGLSVYDFDPQTGTHSHVITYTGIDNPTYLSVSADGQRIYSNSELFDRPQGLVTSLAYDPDRGALSHLDTQPSRGSITSHNSISNDSRFLLVTNYALGHDGPDRSVVVYPIGENGVLGAPSCEITHEGSGPNAERQERSHAHFVHQLPSGIVAVADLGLDRIVFYVLDDTGGLVRRGDAVIEAGAGPRHLAWSADGTRLYCVNELSSSVAALTFNPETCSAALIDIQTALRDSVVESHCSGIQISPDGRYVYVGNRGEDTVAIFAIEQDGSLRTRGHVDSGGATPRDLALSPCGGWLFVSNQDADCVAVFRRDSESGGLTATSDPIRMAVPMCVGIVQH